MALLALHPLLHGTALLPLPGRETAMSEQMEPTQAEISAGWDLASRLELGPDYLGMAIAAVEHQHGKPYGDDADHCDDCKIEAGRRFQAECAHDGEQISMPEFGKATVTVWCKRCGLWRDEQP